MTAEQLTARMASYGQQLSSWFSALPIKTVQYVLSGAIALWLLVAVVQAIMLWLPASEQSSAVPLVAEIPVKQQGGEVNIQTLQDYELFGQAGGASSQPVEHIVPAEDVTLNATKTKLNLVLEGIVHTPNPTESLAVIVFQGKQDQYYVGEELPVGGRVVLSRVLVDHVILDNAGRYESLWLYDDENTASRSRVRPTSVRQVVQNTGDSDVTDMRDDDTATNLASGYRDRLYSNPRSLAEVLRISPAQDDGEMVGYRVSPGRDREQFTQLGFQNNDVVTAVNGIELDEPSKALELYKLMRSATEATFTVERDGQSVEVLVSLSE